jgi:hypothetical protein
MRRLFKYTNAFFIGFWAVLFSWIQFGSYTGFTNNCIQILGINGNQKEKFLTLITPHIASQLKWLFLFLLIFQATLLIIAFKKPHYLKALKFCLTPFIEFPQWLWKSFKILGNNEKIGFGVFLLTLIIQRLWLSYNTDVIYDEAWTYLAFTSKNPFLAACFYPTSNNHILFSHLTQITKILPFDILTNLRLAALFSNILAISTFFFCLRKFVSPISAWCVSLLFAFSFPLVYYGFVARGYSLILLFFTVGFFSLLQILQNSNNKKVWYYLMLSSVLGFYTIPIYLYPFVSLFGFALLFFIIIKNTHGIFKTIQFGVITCILTLIFYLPVFVVSGIKSVTSNKFVQSLSYDKIFEGIGMHLTNTITFFTGSNFGYLALIAAGLLLIPMFKNPMVRKYIYLCFFLIISVPIIIFIHKVLPVERTWIYLLIPILFLIGIGINELKISKWLLGFCIIYAGLIHFGWKKQMLWYDKICKEDYVQGRYFSNYFKDNKVTIITSSRMNSYLKFNKLLKNETWEISDIASSLPNLDAYYIHYLEKDSKLPSGLVKITSIEDYELYKTNYK